MNSRQYGPGVALFGVWEEKAPVTAIEHPFECWTFSKGLCRPILPKLAGLQDGEGLKYAEPLTAVIKQDGQTLFWAQTE